jgi:predicted acyltransferase
MELTDGGVKVVPAPRLVSIDALRGFDMLWILGGGSLFKAIMQLCGQPGLAQQMEHVEWDGFRFYDLIFPTFLFIVGVVLPFSLSQYTTLNESGRPRSAAWGRILRRTAMLIVFGWIYNGFLQFDFAQMRWTGVLQRIGIGYFFAAMAVLHLRLRGQVILFAAILAGYWAVLRFVPAPGFAAFDLTKEGNLVGYIDRLLLPGRFCCYKLGDNEGLLSMVPAIGTTLLGVLAGHWLRSEQTPVKKAVGLLFGAACCLAAGYAWSQSFPINKVLWTSSFVLWAGGWSLLLLATFYFVIDVLGFQRWAFVFIVIGMNPITMYMMQQFVDFKAMAQFFSGGILKYSGTAAPVVLALTGVTLKWLVLLFLYRKKTFLRV